MSEQLYLAQELLGEEGPESALPGASAKGEGRTALLGDKTDPTQERDGF